MKLSNCRYESIKNDVAELYRKYNIKKIPIDPFEICEKMNIKLIKYSSLTDEEQKILLNISPEGFKDHTNTMIFYNDLKQPSKIKFTILHELGHIIRGHKEFSQLAESEAEWFAAYAIAPPPIIDLYDISDFTDIMDIFDTTFNCAWNAMHRYISWKKYAPKNKTYDNILIELFSNTN